VPLSPKSGRVQLIVLALFVEHEEDKSGVQPFQTELGETFEDAGDAEIVV